MSSKTISRRSTSNTCTTRVGSHTITTKIDHPIMLLLDPNYALTPIHMLREDGYQPIARTDHLETVLAILRELPIPEDE